MSDQHEEAHTGPVKTPKQFLTVVVLSFVVPIFVIIGLVYFVTSGQAQACSHRCQWCPSHSGCAYPKNGTVQVKDANRPLPKKGDEVYNAQCAACHATGLQLARLSWATTLLGALASKRAMPRCSTLR